ncbi:MAG TPA: TerB family tellurite resistance protein [Candidatus Krumholzibacteria bacterium]|nr:TerB family tellurite resistance protein [Candidatus Krumholzibacteria bacterium]
MGWMHSLLGGALGFAIAGPLGAVVGAALGHGLGQRGAATAQLEGQERAQAAFFVSTFSMLAKMARADGHVSQEEIAVAQRFMRHELGLDAEAERFAVRVFRAAKDAPTPFEEFAAQFADLFRGEVEMREAMLDVLVRMALADGSLHDDERHLLERAAGIFDLSLDRFEHVLGRRHANFDRHYHTLGVEPGAPMEEVKRAYRRLVTEVHPDKVMARGMPEEFVKVAQERFHEVQNAYEAIRQRAAA